MAPSPHISAKRQRRALIKGLVLIVTLVLAGVAARELGVADMLNERWFDEHIESGPAGYALFIGITATFTAVGLPRQIPCFLAGYGYGFVIGPLLATVGSGLGCLLTTLYARLLGRSMLRRRFSTRLERVDRFLCSAPVSMSVIIRLIPVGSNLLTNLLAGVSSVPLHRFVLGSMLGYLPQSVVFGLLGSGVNVDSNTQIAISVVLFVLSTFFGFVLYRRYRMQQVLATAEDAGGDTDEDMDENSGPPTAKGS